MTSADELDNDRRPIRDFGYPRSSSMYQDASPLAVGAGHINPNQALDPGLIHDATPQDYENLECTSKNRHDFIKDFISKDLYNCSNTLFDLNFPSFIAFYPNDHRKKWTQKFSRTVTNVGEDPTSYRAKVRPLESFKATVSPDILRFGKKL